MSRCRALLILVVIAVCLPGCGVSRPKLRAPGTVQQQRANAMMFDPFTDQDVGPEVVGGRPKDFQKPLSDPERSRLFLNSYWPFQ
jgi:hypothetical protein